MFDFCLKIPTNKAAKIIFNLNLSTITNLLFFHDPLRWRTVIRPELFRPEKLDFGVNKEKCFWFFKKSTLITPTLCLKLGVLGLKYCKYDILTNKAKFSNQEHLKQLIKTDTELKKIKY